MSAKRLLKRIVTVLIMTVGIFILLTVMRAEAMPIQPDIRKVLAQPRVSQGEFEPARAGWNGPESAKSGQPVNFTYEQLGPVGTARDARASLIAAALPDYRLLAAIALVILLLRRIKKAKRKAEIAAAASPPVVVRVSDPASTEIDRAA